MIVYLFVSIFKKMNLEIDKPSSLVTKQINSIKCDFCSEEFVSKNGLFKHLRETGHATLKPTVEKKNVRKIKAKHKS